MNRRHETLILAIGLTLLSLNAARARTRVQSIPDLANEAPIVAILEIVGQTTVSAIGGFPEGFSTDVYYRATYARPIKMLKGILPRQITLLYPDKNIEYLAEFVEPSTGKNILAFLSQTSNPGIFAPVGYLYGIKEVEPAVQPAIIRLIQRILQWDALSSEDKRQIMLECLDGNGIVRELGFDLLRDGKKLFVDNRTTENLMEMVIPILYRSEQDPFDYRGRAVVIIEELSTYRPDYVPFIADVLYNQRPVEAYAAVGSLRRLGVKGVIKDAPGRHLYRTMKPPAEIDEYKKWWEEKGQYDPRLKRYDRCPDTPDGVVTDPLGCSISQLCPPCGTWKNHGAFVSCVAQAANDFVAAGYIPAWRHGQIVSAAARSDVGKPHDDGAGCAAVDVDAHR